jgi:hypothetical protein
VSGEADVRNLVTQKQNKSSLFRRQILITSTNLISIFQNHNSLANNECIIKQVVTGIFFNFRLLSQLRNSEQGLDIWTA